MEDGTRSDDVEEWKLIENVVCGLPPVIQINRAFFPNDFIKMRRPASECVV